MSRILAIRSVPVFGLIALGTLVLLGAGLLYVPEPAEAQATARSFSGCIYSVDQMLTRDRDQDRDRLRTHVFLRIRDPRTGQEMNFGFFRDGIRANARRGTQLRAREFADEIEPILRQLREAAQNRLRVEMTYEQQSLFVNQFRIFYDGTCNS